MADAGKAMMLYKKAYNSKYTYEKLDVVSYNGSLYISMIDGNLGNAPTDETKWQLFLQGGIADNIQATDTHGLVGTAGESSFVQLLLDALAANTVKKSNILNTMEEIEANTSDANIAGALAINALKLNFTNSLDTLNSNLEPHTIWCNVVPSEVGVEYSYQNDALIGAKIVSLDFSSATYSVVILTSAEKHWGYGIGNSIVPDEPYWRSNIFCYFNSDYGIVRFTVLYKGVSQSFNNLNLQSITYAYL